MHPFASVTLPTRFTPPPIDLQDNGDGSYTLSYLVSLVGLYTMNVQLNPGDYARETGAAVLPNLSQSEAPITVSAGAVRYDATVWISCCYMSPRLVCYRPKNGCAGVKQRPNE